MSPSQYRKMSLNSHLLRIARIKELISKCTISWKKRKKTRLTSLEMQSTLMTQTESFRLNKNLHAFTSPISPRNILFTDQIFWFCISFIKNDKNNITGVISNYFLKNGTKFWDYLLFNISVSGCKLPIMCPGFDWTNLHSQNSNEFFV